MTTAASLSSSSSSSPDLDSEGSSRISLNDTDTLLKSYKTSLLLLLNTYQTHFRSLGYIKESTLDLLNRTVGKRTVQLTVRDSRARDAIGTDARIWTELVEVFRNAISSLDVRCYADADAAATPPANGETDELAPYDGPCSSVIVANSATLLADLSRLDSLLAVARNVLTAGEKVQNLAAQTGFDREVCGMINLAVKVTARGFDGEGDQSDEDMFLGVSNGFKKVLITSLQFLSNLVTMNERLKLMLWVELFDSTLEHTALNGLGPPENGDNKYGPRQIWDDDKNLNQPHKRASAEDDSMGEMPSHEDSKTAARVPASASQDIAPRKPAKPMTPYLIFLGDNREKIKQELRANGAEPTTKQVIQEGTARWNDMPDKHKEVWRKTFETSLQKYEENMAAWKAAGGENVPKQSGNEEDEDWGADEGGKKEISEAEFHARLAKELEMAGSNRYNEDNHRATLASRETYPSRFDTLSPPPPPPDSNFRIIESAKDGIRKLEDGKLQILKRLESQDPKSPATYDNATGETTWASPSSPVRDDEEPDSTTGDEDDADDDYENEDEEDDADDEDYLDSEEEDESSDDDEDYAIPGEDGRGLLTDVPLILGPNEIEVLPMIIMSGIVADWKGSEPPSDTLMNMYTIRCHLLLAQENGRNLLRELLIFVAAWDLREDELYFKFMVKIIEAILLNGLMPFAYGAFKESKDIISPAQAVIMKLLTKIFHSRQAYVSTSPSENPIVLLSSGKFSATSNEDTHDNQVAHRPPRPDIQTVHFLFTEFRTNIIPQICALIFLQGQIRMGHAQYDDFPLNLWDMERMYEGVYQYLEFFAILTDHDAWKKRMAEWEVVSELVTLLRELEAAIPKKSLASGGGLTAGQEARARRFCDHPAESSSEQPPPATSPTPLAVERPYDVHAPQQSATWNQVAQTQADIMKKVTTLQSSLGDMHAKRDASGKLSSSSALSSAPVAVERPYDLASPSQSATSTKEMQNQVAQTQAEIMKKVTALQNSLDDMDNMDEKRDANGKLPRSSTPSAAPPTPQVLPPNHVSLHDEPADFEWRNLKKLCVLVLSSLVWKNKPLQDQVRQFGGINALLSCCSGVGGIDEHNPYIREHAIMCLRFLIEGNEECADVVRGLANKGHEQAKARAEAAERKKQQGLSSAGAETKETLSQDGSKGQKARDEQSEMTTMENDQTKWKESEDSNMDVIRELDDDDDNDEDEEVEEKYHDYDDEFSDDPIVPVPAEVLDHHGYETFMDSKGQVGLRRKELPSTSHLSRSHVPYDGTAGDGAAHSSPNGSQREIEIVPPSQTSQIPPPRNPAQLPEWMQMVMKSLPKTDSVFSGSNTGTSSK